MTQPAMTQPLAESLPFRHVTEEMGRRLVGQTAMVERLLIGLLTGGHILLEGVPGLAKTLAVRTLAEILHASFSRIQFTPDLLPADVIGTMVFDQKTQEFHPKKGPLFAHILLSDEINPPSPRRSSTGFSLRSGWSIPPGSKNGKSWYG